MSSLDDKVSLCEAIIGYIFANRLLCARALNTSGNMVIWEGTFRAVPKNAELAVYGDAVMATKLCRDWLDSGLSKGTWTVILQAVASNANLAQVGFHVGLDNCVNLNPGTWTVSRGTMATTVEAILGAVHLDGGERALATAMGFLQLTHEALSPAVTCISLFPLLVV